MKTHSREWFLQQVADARKNIEQWPDWMKEGRRVATASFPQVGEDGKTVMKNQDGEHTAKKKAHD